MNRPRPFFPWLPAVLAAAAMLVFAPAASALQIHLNFLGAAADLADFRNAFRAAADMWQAALADPVEVTIDVRFDEEMIPLFAAAGAVPSYWEVSYADLRAALVADGLSDLDQTAIAHLPPGPTLAFRTFDLDETPAINAGDAPINTLVALTTANAAALGLPGVDLGVNSIGVNEFFYILGLFDTDPSDGVDGLDLASVAAHEIGHVLGFSSGVDDIDVVFARDELPPELAELLPTPEEFLSEYTVLTPLDLFRYSAASAGVIDMTPGADAFFSVDGGATALVDFATGAYHGDGVQASHWREGLDMMVGTPEFDVAQTLTPRDLTAFDAIGRDVIAVPEPATALLGLLAALPMLRTRTQRDSRNQASRRRGSCESAARPSCGICRRGPSVPRACRFG